MAAQVSSSHVGPAHPDSHKRVSFDTNIPIVDKIRTLTDFITKCRFGMMTTRDSFDGSLVSRCMTVAATESNGIDLLFYTSTESGKVDDLAEDPHVNISFLDDFGEWASVSGTAQVVTDRQVVAKHYSPALKAWMSDLGDGVHDGSENDPRIAVIRVRTSTASYAVVAPGASGRGGEASAETVPRRPSQVSRLREISPAELESWRLAA